MKNGSHGTHAVVRRIGRCLGLLFGLLDADFTSPGIVGLLRALKNDLATLNIAISVVAPGITLTDIVAGRDPGESLNDWAKRMRGLGVPINDPGEVATAVVWLMGLGLSLIHI